MILLTLTLLLSLGAPPQAPTKGAEATVVLEERPISLPPLPQTVRQGRDSFKQTHTQIKNGLEDLATGLQAIYKKPEACVVLPAELSVPPEGRDEGVALVGVIDDPEFVRLERAYLDTWKGWQAAMVEGGLAKTVQRSTGSPEPRSKEYAAAKQKGKLALRVPSRQLIQVTREEAAYRSRDENDDLPEERTREDRMRPEERAIDLYHVSKNENDAQNRLALTNLLLPDLAGTWNPLVNHLNDRVLRVMAQEKDSHPFLDPTLNTLRIHAKLAVLERFRKALWYCDLVWCQAAAEVAPPPPVKLARPKASPMDHGGALAATGR